jgi:hypothetical protein
MTNSRLIHKLTVSTFLHLLLLAFSFERVGLPKKEVIQPHLPVRLPCYDFTPVISPAFGILLPCGLE